MTEDSLFDTADFEETKASEPELIVNLWFFADKDTGAVNQLAGRAYFVAGTDAEKLALLRSLAPNDWCAARWFPVPSHHSLMSPIGEMKGWTTAQAAQDDLFSVFGEVLVELEKAVNPQVRFVGEEAQAIPVKMPESPLYVLTPLIEDANGFVRAQGKKRPQQAQPFPN